MTETLFDVALPALPGGHLVIRVHRWSIRPGPAVLDLSFWSVPGVVQSIAIDAGTLVVKAAGTERQLGMDETVVSQPGEAMTLRNPNPVVEGAAVIVTLGPEVPGFATSATWDPTLISWVEPIQVSTEAVPAGPAHVVLQRLTLPPGVGLPGFEATATDWIGIFAGRLGLTLEGEGLPFRWESGEERVFPAGRPLPALAPGWRAMLRNAGDDPLVLYRLTITPLDSATPVATPAA